ncbi:hypothetical protein G7Y79_00014g037030 [Physcia stellaris]|nr:hypothetical protein G7Y79_00014g037030 [Physcia stellaris]
MSPNTTAGSAQHTKIQPWKAHSRVERYLTWVKGALLVDILLFMFDTVVSSDLVITKAQPHFAGHRYLTTADGVAVVDLLAFQAEVAEFSDLLATDEGKARGD